tara:strand:+ start:3110 stop:3895 length:786 start_codon:yes stop_codon:yes gene_type:complete
MKNCILTTASHSIFSDLARFVKQARSFHPTDDIVIMMPEYHMDPVSCKQLKDEYKIRIATYSLQFCNNLADLMTKRFVMFEQYLNQFEYNNVFICDCRDLYFQGNIFDYKFNTDIVCFKEVNKIKDNDVAKGWLNIFSDPKEKEQMANEYNICLGTLLGTQTGILKFIGPFLHKMMTSGLALNNDQIIYNYLIHTNAIESLTVKLEDNFTGPVATVGDRDAHSSVTIKEDGTVYINSVHKPVVVHQYDRLSPELQKLINKE